MLKRGRNIVFFEVLYKNGSCATVTGVVRNQTKGGIGNNRNHNTRLEDQRVRNIELRGQHLVFDALALDWDIAYSKASEDRPNERYIEWEQKKVQFTQDLNPNPPSNVAKNYDANALKFKTVTENHNYTDEGELSSRINFRLPLSLIPNQKGRLRFGYRVRLKTKERNNNFIAYEPTANNQLFNSIAATGATNMTDPNFQAGNYQLGLITPASFLGALDLNNTQLFTAIPNPGEYLALNFNAKENIHAGYIRYDQDITSNLTLITGLRLENTQMNYKGNYANTNADEETNLDGSRDVKSQYTNWLPNVAFKYNLDNDVVLRAAFSTSIARPNYYDLTPFVNTVAGDNTIKAGNPNLKAAYAYNYDFMAEKYYRSVGMISGGIFAKKINNFIYQYRSQNYFQSNFAVDFPNFPNPITDANQNWIFQQARNGQSVQVYGFEITYQRQLDFLPGFLRNFGIYANYTFTRSKAKGITNEDGDLRTNVPLPGTAPNMYNASLSYEDKKITLRVSANFADAYLDELGGNSFNDRYYDKQFFLDANATYRFTKKFRFFVEANNLTNQPLRYFQGTSNQPAQIEYYRPRYNAGLKYDLF